MSRHEATVVSNLSGGTRFRTLCRCGWVSEWVSTEEAAEADWEMHVRLTGATDR